MTLFPFFAEYLIAVLVNSRLAVLLQGDDQSPACRRAWVPRGEGLWGTAVSALRSCPSNLILGV